jgi:Spy/CpxP family protein refolding chaperone
MNKTAVFLSLLLLLPLSPLAAADRPMAEDNAEKREQWQAMFAELNLTDEQKAAIAPIMQKQAEDLRALRDDTSMRRFAKARKAKQINDHASRQVRAVLSPEQQTAYEKIRAEARAAMKERAKERQTAGDSED